MAPESRGSQQAVVWPKIRPLFEVSGKLLAFNEMARCELAINVFVIEKKAISREKKAI